MLCLVLWVGGSVGTFGSVLVLCKTSSRPSGSVPSAPSTSPFAEISLGVSLPGTSSASSSLPLGGQGKRGGSRGAPSVFLGVLPPLPLDFGPARGAGVPLGICLSRAGSLLLLLLLREVEARELLSCCSRPFPASSSLLTLPNSHRTFHDVRVRGSLQSLAPAFYPPASHALRGVDRGRIRGLVHVRVALVDVAVALAPHAVRGQAVVSVGGGRRPCHALLVVAHAVSGRGLLTATALGVEALGHVVTDLDPRIGIGHAVTALGVSVRVPLPVGGCSAVVRDRTLSRIARVTARGQACDYLLLLPACGPRKQDGWPDVDPRRVWRRLPLSLLWPGAAAGVPPVAGGASITALPSVLQELAKFFMNLSGSSSLGATGGLAGVTASAAASGGIACPASTAAGAATICAATVTPAGAGVLPAAPAAVPGVSGEQQRQGESRSRGRRSRSSGDRTDRERSPSSDSSSRRRGRRCRSSSDSSEHDRADASPSRSRHALGGAHTGGSSWDFDRSPRPGASRSSARDELSRSGARRRSPRPSGVAIDDRSSTFAGFRLARGGLGGVSVAFGFFSSVGMFAGPPRLEVLGRILPPASGRSFIGAPQHGSCRWVDCCLACLQAGVGGLPRGY